jgi:hypothetical protein
MSLNLGALFSDNLIYQFLGNNFISARFDLILGRRFAATKLFTCEYYEIICESEGWLIK